MKADTILEKAAQHMRDRAAIYDKPEGERSMGKTVAAFNAITGRDLTTAEGWLMLAVLKQVRAFQNPAVPHVDSLEDGPAYLALMAEELLSGEPINEAAVAPPEEPAQPVNKDRQVKLAVGQVWKDRKGREVKVLEEAHGLVEYPFLGSNQLTYSAGGRFNYSLFDDFDLIELIQDEHGWRPWKATKDSVCPVSPETKVIAKLASGAITEEGGSEQAGSLIWKSLPNTSIVSYKIVE